MVVINITKVKVRTRVEAEDVEHMGDVEVKINVYYLMTMETHPMELIGWRISFMNQGFITSFRQSKRPSYMN